ncbi:MAG: DUF4124 domain-containing protein [Desulfuromonadales bacterium]|nr:DUF4124 domain-containing protein [Desulfuromonadales bacterium]
MLRFSLLILLTCSLLVFPNADSSAQIYKWVDENGTTVFRDTPPPEGVTSEVVPSKTLSATEYSSEHTPVAEMDKSQTTSQGSKAAPSKTKQRKVAKKTFPKVNLYVTDWCGYCGQAKDFFRKNGVPYKVYDIERNKKAAKHFRKINPRGGVPVAEIGGKVYSGFSPAIYSKALGL